MEHVTLSDVEATEAVDGVHLSQLAAGTEMSVQHFQIDAGAVVPEHSHPHEQTGYLTAGTLTFLIDGEEIVVSAGESYAIPGDEPHRVENRGDTAAEGVVIFAPPRVNPDWSGDPRD
jgi:quercetin dioxygenase-like cupin family protein